MEKKKLKKLVLNKEEIVNLNDYEMNHVKGGTSWPCFFRYTNEATKYINTYLSNAMKNSWWPYDCDPIDGGEISEVVIYGSEYS